MSLIVNDLSKKYGEKTVLDHLSFQMPGPGVYALLGTNGAGKTTAIRMILGMLAKNTGEVFWNDKPLSCETCNIGYLAEERGLYPKYTLMDQLLYFASLRGVTGEEARVRIRKLAKRLQVEEYLYPNENAAPAPSLVSVNKSPVRLRGAAVRKKPEKPKVADQLSKGNQQKIQLMAALISDPELIVLDEPMSGLDPVNTDLFRDIIRDEIAKGKYLIMSSHQMATVEEFCTDLTILDHSKVILQGNLNDIKKSYGRVNLHLKVDPDALPAAGKVVADLSQQMNIPILSEKEGEYQMKVTGQEQAGELLSKLVPQAPIITFDLREPSLHEIFVEKVGGAQEDA
ncbi:MAG: ATP-binding cassette domain-containing protein [Lachnospiraceae bacterium]|nr:ATP-binding cassette domain-containing protein [Lachnospiraceae bacterium]